MEGKSGPIEGKTIMHNAVLEDDEKDDSSMNVYWANEVEQEVCSAHWQIADMSADNVSV